MQSRERGDVRVSSYVRHNTWAGVERCWMSAILNIVCGIVDAQADLSRDYTRDTAGKPTHKVHGCQ